MHPLLNHLTVLGERSGVWSGDGESDFLCLGNPRHSQTHRQTQCCSDGCKTIFHTILLVLIFPEVENSKLDKHTAQHPSGFLMNLETCSEQISGWLVISSVCAIKCMAGGAGHGLIGLEQCANHFLGTGHALGLSNREIG